MLVSEIIEEAKSKLIEATGAKAVVLNYYLGYGDSSNNKIQHLITTIVSIYGVPWETLLSKTRLKEVVVARQMFVYFATDVLKMSAVSVARMLKKDHATVLYARNQIRGFIDIEDPETVEKMALINQFLK